MGNEIKHHLSDFIQILKEPDRDDLRQKYADTLEPGHQPRAQLIRIQLDLASPTLNAFKREDLIKWRKDLLGDQDHRVKWVNADIAAYEEFLKQENRLSGMDAKRLEFIKELNPAFLSFSRGFLDALEMTLEELGSIDI